MTRTGRVIAIVGAESTGKSTLATDLAVQVIKATGLACAVVPEFLREWCEREGRTPRADEQRAIAAEQQERIDRAAGEHDIVVADTTPLMTAVYSRLLFADRSLEAFAATAQRRTALTLLTALDLAWVADGLQREGAHVREPVDRLVRALLAEQGLSWSVVSGQGAARTANALAAATPLLLTLAPASAGLFTRLAGRDGAQPAWQWICETCDVPDCERRLLHSLQRR